ncbi:hypothetical protein Kfla_5987 [Kribbella flavida DSM 17836]|uniref:DUF2306 domain-containing protein n=1 Tax=Kribbella flavida (strain DSM 17836 / JCM 10339 / NBRC 14399) TaxID=479435 RepID=D2PST8_KRIFD|nr:hypothetical protein [Kribbella flavida]ADB34990.1 hypothetical protein Kfla_5987 [Kribbella flavida DSM 17836]
MRDIALILHVAAGVVGVLLGPLAIWLTLRRRRLTWAGEIYHWAIALVCLTAVVMVPYDWAGLWVFWPIALASYLFVYFGQRAAESPGGLWYRGVLRGYGGGWIALWTAILVVSADDHPWTWAVPAVLGTALIELLCYRPAGAWTRA